MNAPSFVVKPAVRACPVSPSYEVSEFGHVRRIGKTAWLSPASAKHGGYLQVSLWENGIGKTWFVHQLVAITFHGPRPSPQHHAAHDDGDHLNNHCSNVLWKTKTENEADKVRHGRTNRGERNGAAKLTDAQTREIILRAPSLPRSSGGKRIKKGALPLLAREYGVTASCLHQIISGLRRSP